MYDLITDSAPNMLFSSMNFLLDFEFFGSSSGNVPLALSPRNQSTMWVSIIGLTVSFILIALSRLGTVNLIPVFSRILYKNSNVEKIVQEEYPLTSISSILLLINFIVTSIILLYLSDLYFSNRQLFSFGEQFYLLYIFALIPLYLLFWPIIWFNVIGFLTKEGKMLSENKKNTILFSQISGILFSFLLLVWSFNLKWSKYCMIAFIVLICLMWLYKIFRGIFFSFRHGIAWYYIILYLCTLEILPLVLIYATFWGGK